MRLHSDLFVPLYTCVLDCVAKEIGGGAADVEADAAFFRGFKARCLNAPDGFWGVNMSGSHSWSDASHHCFHSCLSITPSFLTPKVFSPRSHNARG